MATPSGRTPRLVSRRFGHHRYALGQHLREEDTTWITGADRPVTIGSAADPLSTRTVRQPDLLRARPNRRSERLATSRADLLGARLSGILRR